MSARIRLVTGVATAALAVALAAGQHVVASAAPVDEGEVPLVLPTDVATTLDGGGSSTDFTLRLPDGASCPGDSANDNWRVNSFMIPASVDPGSLTYDAAGPVGDGLLPLYGVDTNGYAAMFTEPNEAPGQPGRIQRIPGFTFSVFAPEAPKFIPPGTYTIGLACSLFGETKLYWHNAIQIEADPADQPAGIRWTVADAASAAGAAGGSTPDNGSSRWVIGLPILLGVAAVGAGLLVYRRRRSAPALKGSS
jgi:hypothetical protein